MHASRCSKRELCSKKFRRRSYGRGRAKGLVVYGENTKMASGRVSLDSRLSGESIAIEVLSINAIIGAGGNPLCMKATMCAAQSGNPLSNGLQAATAILTALHRRHPLFFPVAFLAAMLTSGCQTFNMSPEQFAEQQKGHYADTIEARGVEVFGTMLYILRPCF